jgi:CubicO group peptidase (beta-lactamase class C family)
MRTSLVAGLLLALGCAPARPTQPLAAHDELPVSAPEAQGLASEPLITLTEKIRDQDVPLYSLLISRNGVVVYALYTSALTGDEAHYVMSVTKSVTSALVGIAIDRGLIAGPEAPMASLVPRGLASDADLARFANVTLKDVMGMSALDAPVVPHSHTPEAVERSRQFWNAPNRFRFALGQPILPSPGESFQYTDITPLLVAGAVESAAHETLLEYAEKHLFGPLGFRNYEWMHEDPSGTDNAAFGLRLRPIDLQKLGILFLDGGRWRGQQLISRAWVERSFTPWIRSRAGLEAPDYGWFWWQQIYAPGWTAHLASGWKGQRIAVFPAQHLVVTMTACIEGDREEAVFGAIVRDFVIPSLRADGALPPNPAAATRLRALVAEVNAGPPRWSAFTEHRMIPSVARKERHFPLPRASEAGAKVGDR